MGGPDFTISSFEEYGDYLSHVINTWNNPPEIISNNSLDTQPLNAILSTMRGARGLEIRERMLFYGITASVIEVVYTAIRHKDWPRLKGHTQVWVIPIYGIGSQLVFEPLHDLCLKYELPLPVRLSIYAAMFFSLEFATAGILHLTTGQVPWDYNIDDSNNTPMPVTRRFTYGFGGKGYISISSHILVWPVLGFAGEYFRAYIDRIRV